MDWGALAIGTAWAALGVAFGYGWARGGNGHWRWRSGQIHPNAPIFGFLAFACLCAAGYYLYQGVIDNPASEAARFLNRMLAQVPLLLALTAVAIIRKPWGGD